MWQSGGVEAECADLDLVHDERSRLVVAWGSERGVSIAQLPSTRAVRCDWAIHTDVSDAAGDDSDGESTSSSVSSPKLASCGNLLAVAWCHNASAWLGWIDKATGEWAASPVRVHVAARAVGLAPSRGGGVMMGIVDADGVAALRADVESRGETIRVVARRGLQPGIELVTVWNATLLFYVSAEDRALGVARIAPDGVVKAVRHGLEAAPRAMHACAIPTAAALVLSYRGASQDRASVAIVDSLGAVRERPYSVMRAPGAQIEHPRALWLGETFGVAAVEMPRRKLRVVSVGAARSEGAARDVDLGVDLEPSASDGPIATTFDGFRVVVAQLVVDGEACALWLESFERDGMGTQRARIDVTPSGAAARVRRHAASEAVSGLALRLASGSYRSAGEHAVHRAGELSVALRDARGMVFVEAVPAPRLVRIEIAAATDQDEVDAMRASATRLRLAKRARRVASNGYRRDPLLVEEIARAAAPMGVAHVRAVCGGGSAYVSFEVERMPGSDELARWVLLVRAASASSTPGTVTGT